MIVQQPGVRVGTIPPGTSTEVFIAPQPSTKASGKSNGDVQTQEPLILSTLTIIPDAALRSMDDLKAEYGETLRIAADPETIFVAITGSPIRVCITHIFCVNIHL